jgi:lipopolysaccharide export system permease protein
MRIFSRYIFRQAAGALALILLSLSGVVWIALALRQLNLVTTQGQSALTFLQMTTLALPNMMGMIAPVALLVAIIHTLNRLSGDSELIVLTASGANTWTIARPLLVLACLVAAGVALVNHVGMPWSLKLLREYIIQVRSDLIGQVIQPGRFSSPENGLTFHIRDRALDGQLKGLLMHDTRDDKVTNSYLADTATLVKQDGQSFLLMRNGHVLRRPAGNDPPQIIEFESYVVDLDRFEQKTQHIELRPRERYFGELAFPRPDDPDYKRQPGHFRAELHERFANPFYAFAFVLLTVALIGRAQSTRQNRWEAIAAAGVICIGARVAGLAVNNLVTLNARWVPVLYLIPLGMCLVGILMIQLGGRPRRQGRLGLLIGDLVENISGRLRATVGAGRASREAAVAAATSPSRPAVKP